jgi:hypothetical protein
MTPDEQTALADGASSQFWTLFKAHVESEWGKGGERFTQAVQKAASKSDEDGVRYLQMTIFAQQEIQRLMSWPEEAARVAKLDAAREADNHQTPYSVTSRRGPGL